MMKMMHEEHQGRKGVAVVVGETEAGGKGVSMEEGAAGAVRTVETLLRVLPMGLCLAALLVMLKNAQDNDFGSVSYSNLGAFTYLVYANGICVGYSLLSAFYSAVTRPSTISGAWTFFFFDQARPSHSLSLFPSLTVDTLTRAFLSYATGLEFAFCGLQVLTYVILAAGTVSAEIIFLAYDGDEEVTWSKECGVFNGFCRRATASVGITFAAMACYVLLSLISSYRLFSSYDAPIPFHGSKSVEIAAFSA